MLSVIMVGVGMLRLIMLRVVMLNVVITSISMLGFIMLSVIISMYHCAERGYAKCVYTKYQYDECIYACISMLREVILNVNKPTIRMLNAVMLSVRAP
jgi:hypothetical protein